MKKFVLFLTAGALLLALTGCNPAQEDPAGPQQPQPGSQAPEQTVPAAPETAAPSLPVTPETWGVENSYSVFVNGREGVYKINTPNYSGNDLGRGNICEQVDGTMTLISGQWDYSPQASNAGEVFPACQEQVEYTLRKTYGPLADNFVFTFDEGKPVTVGSYEMQVFEGAVSFVEDKLSWNLPFVAYATMLEGDWAYAYWVVFDITNNGGATELAARHAYNMALTFREN